MANPAPIISQINAFNATEGTIISFNIVGGTSIVRSNIIYIYDLSDNSLICTHLYISTESIHELPANTDPSIAYASGKSSADFTNGKQYYAQIQTFTNTAGTEGASGASIAKLFWCLVDPTLTINTIPSSISTTSYNVGVVYNSNTTATSNIVQQYQFNLYSATGVLVQSSGVITGSGAQQGTSTAYDLSYNFTGLSVGSSYYITVEVTTTQGMTVSAQSSTFTVSIETPTLGEATVVNNACDGYISVTSNLSGEYGGSASGSIATFETASVNEISSLTVDIEPQQDLNGYDHPWVGGAGKNLADSNYPSAQTANQYNLFLGILKTGTYTLSTNRKDVAIYVRKSEVPIYSGDYIGVSYNGNPCKFTVDEDGWCFAHAYRSGTTPSWADEPITEVQLELGSTATAFEPYENLCPISGWDSVDVTRTGKNLWDRDNIRRGVYTNSDGTTQSGSASTNFSSQFIKVKPNTIYSITMFGESYENGSLFGVYYDEYKNGIKQTANIQNLISNNSKTFTTPSNAHYIVFTGYRGTGIDIFTTANTMVCKETPTTYEPYNGQTYTINLNGTRYGGKLDVVSGVLTVDRAYVDLGTLTWSKINGNNYANFYTKALESVIKFDVSTPTVVSSAYKSKAYNSASATADGYIWANSQKTVRIKDTTKSDMTASEFATAMNGVQLVYELAEPRTIQLDPQTITTLVGVNNVWANSGDVSVTYNIPITNLLVKRQDTADISGKWLTLYSQPITQASDMDFTFIDFLNQYGKTYKYALVPLLTQEQSGVEVEVEGGYTVSDEVVSIFDGVFVADNTAIYKLKAGVNYGDLSKVQEVGSINTIGSQYPIIVSNSKVDYRTASLSATIVADDYYDNGNLNRMDMVQKRELMESFFTNKRAKILKDWNGNIWLVVFIDNINIAFINEYGMGIATLTATWTEIGDVTSEEDLQNTRIINVG